MVLELSQFHKVRLSRIRLFYGIVGLVFLYLFGGLTYRQVLQRRFFIGQEHRQSLRRLLIPGIRGKIYDRNGVLLADNKEIYSVNLCLPELNEYFQREYLKYVNYFRDHHVIFSQKNLRLRVKEEVVREQLEIINKVLGKNLSLSGEAIERHGIQKFLLPMKIVKGISQQEYERLMYLLPRDSPFQLSIDEVRYYPYNELACHVLGYVVVQEKDSDLDVFGKKIRSFNEKRQVGKTGIELLKDDVLKGEPGYELWQVDPAGKQRGLVKSVPPQHGHSVLLSLDKSLQEVAERSLGKQRGCAIVIDVNTGEVLALASRPAYDSNALVPKISQEVYQKITNDLAWLNLATQGKFPLGSVFKLVSSIAFLRSGEVSRDDTVFCDGGVQIGDRRFRCNNHPWGMEISFREAIARSCNTFFYENSKKVKKSRLIAEAVRLGFSEKTGIELPYEASGFVPSEQWKRSRHLGPWVVGDTVNLSIGQGYLLVTPMEVVCFMASIAKNRERTHPTIFLNGNNGTLSNDRPLGIDKEDYQFIIGSMEDVIENRSGKRARLNNIALAGKTGTAQYFDHGKKRNIAWFACFGPVEDPDIAVVVMVQEQKTGDNYFGGANAAPIARQILEFYFNRQ